MWIEIKGRPRWFRHLVTGEEKYIDPHATKPRFARGAIPKEPKPLEELFDDTQPAISYDEDDHIWPYVSDEE